MHIMPMHIGLIWTDRRLKTYRKQRVVLAVCAYPTTIRHFEHDSNFRAAWRQGRGRWAWGTPPVGASRQSNSFPRRLLKSYLIENNKLFASLPRFGAKHCTPWRTP